MIYDKKDILVLGREIDILCNRWFRFDRVILVSGDEIGSFPFSEFVLLVIIGHLVAIKYVEVLLYGIFYYWCFFRNNFISLFFYSWDKEDSG